jgi:hypothetical protein
VDRVEIIKALKIAYKLLDGLLTDNQLDFKPAGGTTARSKITYIRDVLWRAEGGK